MKNIITGLTIGAALFSSFEINNAAFWDSNTNWSIDIVNQSGSQMTVNSDTAHSYDWHTPKIDHNTVQDKGKVHVSADEDDWNFWGNSHDGYMTLKINDTYVSLGNIYQLGNYHSSFSSPLDDDVRYVVVGSHSYDSAAYMHTLDNKDDADVEHHMSNEEHLDVDKGNRVLGFRIGQAGIFNDTFHATSDHVKLTLTYFGADKSIDDMFKLTVKSWH